MVLDKEKLLKDGFLSFNLKDIDESLYNELYQLSNKKILETFIKHIRYEFSVKNQHEFEIIKKICEKYISNVQTDDNNIRLNSKFKNNFDDFISVYSELENYSKNEFQYWFFNNLTFSNDGGDYFEIKNNLIEKVNSIHKFILSHFYNITKSIYLENKSVDLTLYTKNGHIVNHQDGFDENRLCVILIYLNDDYKEGYGGELKISTQGVLHTKTECIVKPEFGNVAILDFTKNNPHHEVLSVIDDNFKRFAFIKFFYK